MNPCCGGEARKTKRLGSDEAPEQMAEPEAKHAIVTQKREAIVEKRLKPLERNLSPVNTPLKPNPCSCSVPFPLTPALSLRERETSSTDFGVPWMVTLFTTAK